MTLKKNDFVSVEYTGRLKDTGEIFDTTYEEVAKSEGVHNTKVKYGPITICIGQNQIIPGIDETLIGKKEGESYNIDLSAEKAFGKKDAKLLKLVPSNIFKKQGIRPFVGLEVQLDNMPGIVRTVSGGRILVDFNHPLSGRDVSYEIKVVKTITDPVEKISSYLSLILGIKDPKVKIDNDKAEIEMELPLEISKELGNRIKDVVPEVRIVEFIASKGQKTEKKD